MRTSSSTSTATTAASRSPATSTTPARAASGSVVIRHDGKVAASRVLRADNEGELDLETFRRNTAGSDTFKLSVKPVGGSACSLKVTLR